MATSDGSSSLARRCAVLAALAISAALSASACKKTPPPSANADAAGTPANVTAEPSVGLPEANDAGSKFPIHPRPPRPVDAGPMQGVSAPPLLPLASGALELVAIGTSFNSKILWLQDFGSRVWLSGVNYQRVAGVEQTPPFGVHVESETILARGAL